MVSVRVPASTANLGPAFDCLGLALDLYNEASFSLEGQGWQVEIEGEGAEGLPRNARNRMAQAFERVHARAGQPLPPGVRLRAHNRIPLGSGLGSSAAAALAGMLAANALLGEPLSQADLLQVGADIEGHADNLAAALLGGLVLVTQHQGQVYAEQLAHQPLRAVVVLPELDLSTRQARAALPKQVPMPAAVANIGHSLLLAEALRRGDLALLARAMHDQLHQPARLALLPGAAEAIAAAQAAGAAAALSGAGPSVIAFVEPGREEAVAAVMAAAFKQAGLAAREYLLDSAIEGAKIIRD
ncbi:MAG: homoserine kinase [Anaerolineales bacterium]|nr:homoserine kinase [Anaerolineales bacterium]